MKLQKPIKAIVSDLSMYCLTDFDDNIAKRLTDMYDNHQRAPRNVSVKVLLLEKVQFLVALLDPNVCPRDQVGSIYQLALNALVEIFVNDTKILTADDLKKKSSDERENNLLYELSLYVGGNWMSSNGASKRRQEFIAIVEKNFELELDDKKMSSKEWWNAYGMDEPHIQSIAMTILSLLPSTCPIEQSFSILDSIHK